MSLERWCLRCPKHSPPPYVDNRSYCLAGPEPVDTQERFRTQFCPLGRFPATDAEIAAAFERDRRAGPCCGG